MNPWLIVTLVASLIGATIIITVYLINRNRLKEIARERASNELAFKVKAILKKGDYNVVTIGLLDNENNESQEIEVRSDELQQDFSVGEKIWIS